MKKRKKLSLLLSAVLFFNIALAGNFTVKAEEVSDAKLQSVSVDKKLAKAGDSINVTIEAINDLSGLAQDATLEYVSPSGQGKSVDLKLVDGKYQGTLEVTAEDEEGTWKVNFVSVSDSFGNTFGVYNSVLNPEMGQDMSAADFTVDLTAPKVTKCDPENGVRNVAVDKDMVITFSENIVEGSAFDTIAVVDKDGNILQITKTINANVLTLKTSELMYNGSYTIVIPSKAVSDIVGNEFVDAYTAKFTTPLDETTPEFTTVMVDKKAVKSGTTVNVTVKASDAIPGLANEAYMVYTSGNAEKEVILKLENGMYTGQVVMDANEAEGLWAISYIILNDKVSNITVVYNSKVHEELGQDLSAGNIVVDNTAPVTTVAGVEEGKTYNHNVIPTFTTNEAATVTATLNGKPYIGQEITADGNYELIVTAVDLAGNTSTSTVKFAIDKVAAVITVAGVEEGKTYNHNVTPTYTTNEAATVTATLNGKTYNGEEITADGKYELIVTAVDLAGNTSTSTVKFAIDKTAAVITVAGVEEGKTYNHNVTPTYTTNEDAIATATLNGKTYNGEEITADGNYELIVTSVDLAGNTSTSTVKFAIDKTAAVITVAGVEDGKAYNHNVTPTYTATENATVTATLNGKPYNGEEVAVDGKYELIVTSVDLVGNTSTKTVKFAIDKTAPVTTVAGVEEGKTYNHNVTITFTTNEDTTVTATLNGKPYNGEVIKADGKYELIVTSVDLVGNTQTQTIKFAIDKTAPKVTVVGVESGKVYESTVTPVITVDDKDAVVTYTLDGKAYDGKAITAVGMHTLVVTVTDSVDNKTVVTMNFEVKAKTAAATTTNTPTTTIPKTGAMVDMSVLVVSGLLLMLAGAAFVVTSRKRSA